MNAERRKKLTKLHSSTQYPRSHTMPDLCFALPDPETHPCTFCGHHQIYSTLCDECAAYVGMFDESGSAYLDTVSL